MQSRRRGAGEREEGGSEVVGDGDRVGWDGSPDVGDTSKLAQGQQEGQKFPHDRAQDSPWNPWVLSP